MHPNTRQLFVTIALAALAAVGVQAMHADDATWKVNPVSNDWNTAQNWRPETIPNSRTAVATFGVSNTTTVLCQDSGDGYANTYVGDVVFAPGASAYSIRITPDFDVIYPSLIVFNQQGIINNSGIAQNLVAANSGSTKASGRIYFEGTSSAGENVVITNEGGASATGDGYYGGFTNIGYNVNDRASAGRATFMNNGGTVDGSSGGFTFVLDASTAEGATFISNPGAVFGARAGYTWVALYSPGNIYNSTFIANAATVIGAEGGWAEIDGGTSEGANFIANGATIANAQGGQIYVYGGDGYATFTGKGGRGSGAQGGLIDLFNLPNSDQTVVVAEAGRIGGLGGTIMVEEDAVLDQGQFQLRGNGTLDLTNATTQIVSIGSLAGNGIVSLVGHTLSIGNNNVSTSFSGLIQDGGGIMKVGSGMLTLTGANTYSGPTTVTMGMLRVNNSTDSGTGSGPVKIQAGIVGGTGTIAGPVTIGTGNGPGAVLAPSVQGRQLAILTLEQGLTFKGDGSYSYKLNANNATGDQVIAHRVNIQSGAQFSFQSLGNRRLPIGTTFIAISNTAGTPISGTFANLPDGSTFSAGRNNYQASYEGGDGNDLTLTVVP
jgi:autotransporter-associated beta strand protein